jgi:hypothetical protein
LIEQGRFSLLRKVEDVTALLAAASEEPAFAMQATLTALWPTISGPLARSLNTRADQRLRSMKALLRDRCEKEVAGITDVLAELKASIDSALSEAGRWQQASLFKIDEGQRQQLLSATLSRLNCRACNFSVVGFRLDARSGLTRSLGGGADYELGGEDDLLVFVVRIGRLLQEEFGGGAAQLTAGLADRGERDRGRGGEVDVVVADDGEVVRHPQP